jgi:hypothetical protein
VTTPREAMTVSLVAITVCGLVAFAWPLRPISENRLAPIPHDPSYNMSAHRKVIGKTAIAVQLHAKTSDETFVNDRVRMAATIVDSALQRVTIASATTIQADVYGHILQAVDATSTVASALTRLQCIECSAADSPVRLWLGRSK